MRFIQVQELIDAFFEFRILKYRVFVLNTEDIPILIIAIDILPCLSIYRDEVLDIFWNPRLSKKHIFSIVIPRIAIYNYHF